MLVVRDLGRLESSEGLTWPILDAGTGSVLGLPNGGTVAFTSGPPLALSLGPRGADELSFTAVQMTHGIRRANCAKRLLGSQVSGRCSAGFLMLLRTMVLCEGEQFQS